MLKERLHGACRDTAINWRVNGELFGVHWPATAKDINSNLIDNLILQRGAHSQVHALCQTARAVVAGNVKIHEPPVPAAVAGKDFNINAHEVYTSAASF